MFLFFIILFYTFIGMFAAIPNQDPGMVLVWLPYFIRYLFRQAKYTWTGDPRRWV